MKNIREKSILKILGGELLFRMNDVSKEMFAKRANYANELVTKMFEKEFTPPTKEEIRKELLS